MWLFHAEGNPATFPSGVWGDRTRAEEWITRMRASGTLSAYVVGESAYDSNVRLGLLKLSEARRSTQEFMRTFSTAVDHRHFEHGAPIG